MAEFQVVMKYAAKLCETYGGECRKCPANDIKHHTCMVWPEAIEHHYSTPEQAEQIIMDWAAKHPELRYPTWEEWQNANFPGSSAIIMPCAFIAEKRAYCDRKCSACISQPIPADIAAKLKIKPIGEK